MIKLYNLIETFKILFLTTIPIFVYNLTLLSNEYIFNSLPESFYIKPIFNVLSNIFYIYPVYLILYYNTYRKVIVLFEKWGYELHNTSGNIYIILLFNVTYILSLLLSLYTHNSIVISIFSIFGYSLYISQMIYLFLEHETESFNNVIDFYNSNVIVLNIVSGVYYIIECLLFIRFKLICFLLYSIITLPILLKLSYNKKTSRINIFYFSERILTKVLCISKNKLLAT